MTVRPLPEQARRWPRADVERFIEMAGKHLSDGVRPELADQLAWLEMVRVRKQRTQAEEAA